MRSFRAKQFRLALLLCTSLALFFLSGCSSEQSILAPAAPASRQILDLFTFIFIIMAAIFILVEGLLVYFVIRYQRRKADEATPQQIHGNTPLEVTWTLVPALILIVVFALTIRTMSEVGPSFPPAIDAVNVRVVGHQWWWEYRYPDLNIVTADEMHVPIGETINVTLDSDNVIHSFWVPRLAGKMDVVPGQQNQTWLLTGQPGDYYGQCAEFCGEQHANMRFRVVAQTKDEFDAWVKDQTTPPAPSEGLAAQGKQVFEAGACVGCHSIQGTKGVGITGPNLTHFGSRTGIAAETLTNTPENLATWLHNPQAVKPGALMPNLNLSDSDVAALVAYLESLK